MASTVRPTGARVAKPGVLPGALLAALLALGCEGDPAEVIDEPPCRTALVGYPESGQTGSLRHVHDPEIVQGADAYYVFSTNDGVPIRRSTDLLRWEFLGRVFPGGYPSWAPSEVPGVEGVWAPGMGHFDGEYHLYYSLSTFGSPRSVIGLTTSPTLDPQDPAYGWQDQGKVVESYDWDPANAIDPAVVEDPDGRVWLAWGSWGGGIVMRELDPATGLLSTTNDTLYTLARRPVERAIEGPYIVRRGGYYYLFVGFDLCCRGVESTYSVRVGRAEQVTGPYLDRDGVPMMEGGGTLVLESYGPIRGPGHASVLEQAGGHLLVHHYYDANDDGVPHLQIRP
ncbi:MAG: arabinan endo-1,5-alpha-L-arabinosidase, partial [Longimicrobiales bacterium]|nr:arabinan endo-1,5-alpha-L-arabinosidase [Longimicrobiales bacterium]